MVDTLHIQGNAVTVPVAAHSIGNMNLPSGTEIVFQEVTIQITEDIPLMIQATWSGGSNITGFFSIKRGGLYIWGPGVGAPLLMGCVATKDNPGPGTHTYQATFWVSASGYYIANRTLMVTGFRR